MYDIRSGFDLAKKDVQERMLQKIKRRRPRLVVTSALSDAPVVVAFAFHPVRPQLDEGPVGSQGAAEVCHAGSHCPARRWAFAHLCAACLGGFLDGPCCCSC